MSDERDDVTERDETAEPSATSEQPGFTSGPAPSEEDLADPEIGGAAGGGPAGA